MASQSSAKPNRSVFAIYDDERIEFLFSEYSDSCSLWIGKNGVMGDLALAVPAPDSNNCYVTKLMTRTTSALTLTLAQIMALKMKKQVFVSTALDTSNSKFIEFVTKFVADNWLENASYNSQVASA